MTTARAARDRQYGGVASTFLGGSQCSGTVHLRPNHTFRLPAPDVPVNADRARYRDRALPRSRRAPGYRGDGPVVAVLRDRRRATDFYGDELEDSASSAH